MATADDKILCMICGGSIHAAKTHLTSHHPDWTLEQYTESYPGAELMSEYAKLLVAQLKAKEAAAQLAAPVVLEEALVASARSEYTKEATPVAEEVTFDRLFMYKVFNQPASQYKSARGADVPVTVYHRDSHADMIPEKDSAYIWEPEDLKCMLMALELEIPLLVWGHAGTGKTEAIEQICAHTHRPLIRVQHTVNTEESHIVGQWTARAGETIFEMGPLALAMKHGWTYLADEYDFALPSVLAIYQPVLEGKSLVIKEADAANRIIKPHPRFRFVATGNTNGSGDDTGLYSGTVIQNAANYDRFGIVVHKKYMDAKKEQKILTERTGIDSEDATLLINFGTRVREAFGGGRISNTISPRALINIARIGSMRGDYRVGINLAFANKLSEVDKEAVNAIAQRLFG